MPTNQDQSTAQGLEVFISYAHRDARLREQLEVHLALLRREGAIQTWHDRKISAGTEWAGQIDTHLEAADIILLLVSPDFIASQYCWDVEVKQALARHEAGTARVIPVLLRPVDWQGAPFGKLQALPTDARPVTTWKNRDAAWKDVADGLRGAVAELTRDAGLVAKTGFRNGPASDVPNNLPPRSEFIGREREKARVNEALASRYPLVCIEGIGGIGKTSLALEVTYQCLAAGWERNATTGILIFDGYIWASAKDRELGLNDVLDAIARTLNYPGITQQPLSEKQDAVYKLLQSGRYLLVIDNFETVADRALRDFLLALPEPSKALITSRTQDLRQTWSVSLKGMDQKEAVALMRSEGHRLGLLAVEQAPHEQLARLYQGTGGAPLAIKWAIGQIKQKGQSLDSVLAYLYNARGDIFQYIFAQSWELLDERARHVLMVMPFFATSAARDAIAAASDLGRWDLDDAVGQLVQLWLVETNEEIAAEKQRYNIHPLTRSFSRAKLASDNQWGQEARLRAAQYFIELARQMGGWSRREGFPWFELELANLFSFLDWAYESRCWFVVVDLLRPMLYFLRNRGYWRERIEYCCKAVECARNLGDARCEAEYQLALAWVYQHQGRLEEAQACALAALQFLRTSQDQPARRLAFDALAAVAKARSEIDQAERFGKLALEAAEASGDESAIHLALGQLGRIALDKGDYQGAEYILDAALAGATRLQDEERIGARHIDFGRANLLQGRYAEARGEYEIGLSLSQKVGRQDTIGHALFGLAQAEARIGASQRALELARAALDIFTRLAMRRERDECEAFIRQLEEQAA